MSSPHYSLRWNNHQSHLLTAFDSLLQNETLVDVTLVCEETSFKAHKVVLSACSPYFQRIFSETPCKHPVIVLKDLRGWEVQAIVDFMYRGEISVGQEQLSSLIKAAESLQVRGLAHTERIPVLGSDKEGGGGSSRSEREFSPAASSTPPSHGHYNGGNSGGGGGGPNTGRSQTPTPSTRLPQIPHLPNISFTEFNRHCSPPLARRKQPRPRRRSGDTHTGGGPQDLSKAPTHSSQSRLDMAENLSMKKQNINNNNNSNNNNNNNSSTPSSRLNSTPSSPQINMKMERDDSEPPDSSQAYPMELTTTPQDHRMDYTADSLSMPPPHHDSSLENSFSHLASISALSLTPPHLFALDSQIGLFHGMENCRNPLLNDMEPRPDNHISRKKMGRPKGQHSAPRGGPPRSWTNAELTEALQHVWNKKMTTSQASRIFGIPYNSLLMYVRGKYGKSLKLEQLKKECFGEHSPLDLLGLGNISNNNNPSTGTKQHKIPEPPEHMMLPPGFNLNQPYPPVPTSFYQDFTPFPVPVSMVHLLSDKNRDGGGGQHPGVVDYSKDDSDDGGGGQRHHRNTPLDFVKDDIRSSPPMPLDFVKEETNNPHHDQTNCSSGLEPNSVVECESPRDRRDQNGQD